MWEFYLAASEMAFRHQGMMVFQIQLAKRVDAVPLTRDYIAQRGSAGCARSKAAVAHAAAAWPANSPRHCATCPHSVKIKSDS